MTDDYRKRRGPLACAECRRLKLKCDRKVPCSSCSKRGCGAVCPNGTLAAGPGNRFVLADTRHLHEQIETMSKKISELEDVLAGLHTGDDQHPLLTEEHMLVKALPSTEKANDASNRPLASLLGTLAIGDEPRFYGPNAASDFLLQIPTKHGAEAAVDGDEKWNVSSSAASTLAPDLLALARTFPLANLADLREEVWPRLEALLLPEHVARGLVESYYTYAGWMFEVSVPDLADVTPHDLGLLSILMAVGAMVQISTPNGMYPTQAADLYQIARISLSLDSVLDHPTVQAVRAVHLMAWFLHMSDHPGGVTISYNLLGLNAQLCHSLGLHRDDTPWNLDPGEKQRRRTALWDVVAFDCWVSEALGRPPSFSVLHLDAKMPEEEDAEGQSFRQWIHHFTNACVLKVLDQAFGVARLTHATVLRLDRVVREEAQVKGDTLRVVNVGKPEELFLANPAATGVEMGMEAEDVRVRRAMQRTTVFVLTQKCLLYLHRSFFAQALADSPTDPLKSKHAQSVLAAFRAAFYITASVRACHAALPALSVRYWFLWSEAFSACVILGSVVAKSPGSGLAPAAWVELDRMYELFDTLAGSSESQCIRRLLPKLRRLRNSAQASYATFTGKDDVPAVDVEEMMDEMEMKYGTGWTRLVDTSPAAPSPPAPAREHQQPQQQQQQSQGGTWRQPQPITPVPVVSVPQHQQQYHQPQQQQQQFAPMGSYPAAGPSHMSIPGPSSSSSFQQGQAHNSTLTPPMFTDLNIGQFDLLPQYPQHQQPEPAFPDLDYVPPPPLPLLPQTMFDDGSNVLLGGTSAWDLPQTHQHQQQYGAGGGGAGGQGEYDASGIDLNAAWNEFVGSMGVGGPQQQQDVQYNVNVDQFAHPPQQQQQQQQLGGQIYPTQYGYAG
ncbi:hypothetical protein EXIGLDRAFT_730460 [Exidia glandulosa HHB12029]|uniref:Zn(2)-C6 fungal-type domain-containing protein n=1 Tax=Exidia glandulosa HHB12029 TaxID=1314781 RepID=A0A165L8W7_EXIGL|nr:hypothetical protein EXIGLDRAFT_730460 [Exidia glandulosa HHB12029]